MKRLLCLVTGAVMSAGLLFNAGYASNKGRDEDIIKATPATVQGTLGVLPPELLLIILQGDMKSFFAVMQTSSHYKAVMDKQIPNFHWSLVSEKDTIGLARLKIPFLDQITKAQIRLDRWEDSNFKALITMKNIQILDLSGNCCYFEFDQFEGFEHLKELNLNNNFLPQEDENQLRKLPHLNLSYSTEMTYKLHDLLVCSNVKLPHFTKIRLFFKMDTSKNR